MAKICVATFNFTTDNYGQVLQYLATQEYLRACGHDPYLLYASKHRRTLFRKILDRMIRSIKKEKKQLTALQQCQEEEFGRWWLIDARNEQLHPRGFERFRRENFKIVEGTFEDVIEQGFDVYAVGSDQTWSNGEETYLLSWTPDSAKRIAIAPSVSHGVFSAKQMKRIARAIRRFDFVTVREDNALKLCQQIGYEGAKQILDPTCLIKATDYDKYAKQPNVCKPYVFLYLLGHHISVDVADIMNWAEKNGYEVLYVASQGRDDDYPKIYAEVGEWLGLIKGASYVFTNSFHGSVLSMIYHKQFLVFPIVGVFKSMNTRINNLVKTFGVEQHVYAGNLDAIRTVIAWDVIEERIEANKAILDEMMHRTGLLLDRKKRNGLKTRMLPPPPAVSPACAHMSCDTSEYVHAREM